jgi:predicted transcriptional regulator
MGRRASPHATNAELEILQVLWQQGPSTVRAVQETLDAIRPTGYTTVLKLLQIMTEKGLTRRDESQRAHVYEAALTEEEVQADIVTHMVDRVFAGSASKLVFRALSATEASPRELDEIRKLLDALKGGTDESD